jgi:hypothetical protein
VVLISEIDVVTGSREFGLSDVGDHLTVVSAPVIGIRPQLTVAIGGERVVLALVDDGGRKTSERPFDGFATILLELDGLASFDLAAVVVVEEADFELGVTVTVDFATLDQSSEHGSGETEELCDGQGMCNTGLVDGW